MSRLPSEWVHGFIDIAPDNIRLHYVEAGSESKTDTQQSIRATVVLLHGFPELWYSWRKMIGPLSKAGLHVLAPDLRGYGQTTVPGNTEDYTLQKIALDVVTLVKRKSPTGTAVLIGHDFGSALAFAVALRHRDIVSGLVSLSNPYVPPELWAGGGSVGETSDADFSANTTYRAYFQNKGHADDELSRDIATTFKAVMRLPSESLMTKERLEKSVALGGVLVDLPDPLHRSKMLSEEELQYYVHAFNKTGFTGALNWYRNDSANRKFGLGADSSQIFVPTLMIAGEKDPIWPPHMVVDMKDWIPNLSVILFEEVGHWIQQQVGEQVATCILDWMQKPTVSLLSSV